MVAVQIARSRWGSLVRGVERTFFIVLGFAAIFFTTTSKPSDSESLSDGGFFRNTAHAETPDNSTPPPSLTPGSDAWWDYLWYGPQITTIITSPGAWWDGGGGDGGGSGDCGGSGGAGGCGDSGGGE